MLLNRWPVKSAAITLPTELQPLPLTRSNLLPSFVCSFLSTKLKRGPNFTLLNKKRFSFWNHCCCCCCCCCCYLRSSSFSHIPKKFNYVRFKVRPSRGVWRSRDFGSDDFISKRQKIYLSLWALVVAHMDERSLLTPEIRGLNPVIRKFYLLSTVFNLCWNEEKRGCEWPNLKQLNLWKSLFRSRRFFKRIMTLVRSNMTITTLVT